MTCTNCALNIERGLKKLIGVQNVNVDFVTERVSFEYVPAVITLEGIIDA